MTFAVQDTVHDFKANHIVRYFRERPLHLFLVAGVGIIGGFVAFTLSKLSPGWQRRVKLLALGLAAGFVMVAGGYFSFWLAGLSPQMESALGFHGGTFWTFLLSTIAIAAVIWFEFYQVFKHRVYDRQA